MDPVRNPYSPGAGTPPPELVGRQELREQVHIALQRITQGRSAKSILLVGLRGVGKTVLLDRMREDAIALRLHTIWIEAPENRSLPAILSPQLRSALLRLSTNEKARELAQRALRGLSGFVSALKVKYQDIEIGIDYEPEPGLADNGNLELDLPELLESAGDAARSADTAIIIFIDELQYVEESELAALITAMHRTAQRRLPIALVGAGLPQLRGKMGNAKSYAERLFDFPMIGKLNTVDAKLALSKPALVEGVEFEKQALNEMVTQTQGYPYFLQEWGKHTWDISASSPITTEDVQAASTIAIAALDESFFRVRFDRLTPLEKRYLRAMAELGAGPHRSGEVATQLGREVSSLGPTRAQLISKGMIWSPSHGDTAFTVPLFDEYMKRIMPGDEWKIE